MDEIDWAIPIPKISQGYSPESISSSLLNFEDFALNDDLKGKGFSFDFNKDEDCTSFTDKKSAVDDSPPSTSTPLPKPSRKDAKHAVPNVYVPDTLQPKKARRLTPFELHKLFGCRRLKDFHSLEEVGEGIQVTDLAEDVESTDDFINSIKRKRGGAKTPASRKLELVGMDIGYGDGVLPGGYKYCLTLVDSATRHCFIYGLKGLTGTDIQDALWKFIIDAGGIPQRIRDTKTMASSSSSKTTLDKGAVKNTILSSSDNDAVGTGSSLPVETSQTIIANEEVAVTNTLLPEETSKAVPQQDKAVR